MSPAPALSRAQRARLLRAAERLGMGDRARHLWELARPDVRRDRIDTERFCSVLAATLGREDSCIDIGAHRGDLLEHMVRVAPRGRHIACEPLPDFAADLNRRFPHVAVHQVAVWDAPGSTSFDTVPREPALSAIKAVVDRAQVVPMEITTVALDDIVEPGCDYALLKIDVEGAELQVLRGARDLLQRCRPLIYFEHHGAARVHGTDSAWLYELLCGELGYRIFGIDGSGPLDAARFASAEQRDMSNFLARAS